MAAEPESDSVAGVLAMYWSSVVAVTTHDLLSCTTVALIKVIVDQVEIRDVYFA